MADPSTVVQAIGTLPSCVVSCLLDGFTATGCDASNIQTCYCTNVNIQYNVTSCTLLHCNSTEQAIALKSQQVGCAGVPIQSRANFLFVTLTVLSAVLWTVTALRFLIRWRITRKFWWDDWCMMIATGFFITSTGVEYAVIAKGLGKHVWDVKYSNINSLQKLYFVINVLYVVHLGMIKASILFLYLRIFRDTKLRNWYRGTLIFVAINFLVFFFCLMFRCTPWNNTWKTFPDIDPNAQCLSFEALILTGAGLSMAEDIWILLLPIPQLLKLELNKKKKIQLVLMFNIGIFACVTSMVRLRYIVKYNPRSTDPTYENVSITFWSTLEVGVAYLCANLPLMRPLLRVIAPRICGSSSSEYYTSTTISSPHTADHVTRFSNFSQLEEACSGDLSFTPEPLVLKDMGESQPHAVEDKPDKWSLHS